MGLLVDKSALGFRKRSWRYSMLVNNGIIEKMFIEPDLPGDPFEVSDADTMLRYLDPEAKAPQEVSIFTKPNCPFCIKAKAELSAAGYDYEEIVLGKDASLTSLKAITGRDTVPQIFIGVEFIGDSEALRVYLQYTVMIGVMHHDIYLIFDQSHLCRLSQAYLLFLYENHDPLRVLLPILFRVLFYVLLKRLGFPRFIIGYACTHTLFQA